MGLFFKYILINVELLLEGLSIFFKLFDQANIIAFLVINKELNTESLQRLFACFSG